MRRILQFSIQTYTESTHLNCLGKELLMSNHNMHVHFYGEIRKIILEFSPIFFLNKSSVCNNIIIQRYIVNMRIPYLTLVSGHKSLSKLCRPRSDAAECSV